MWRIVLICTLLCNYCYAIGQKVNVGIAIFEEYINNSTPAMVCITDLDRNVIVVPPDGAPAGKPTYPDIFFKGIDYQNSPDWVGPIRRMDGKGEVNGQRTYVYGENRSLPYFYDSVMYQVPGDFSIRLDPGKYKISIQRGNEYVPLTENFIVQPGDKNVRHVFVLKRWIDLPARGWYSGDVHVHHALDKPHYIEYLLQLARAEDVHVVNMLEMGDRRDTYFKSPYFRQHSICRDNRCLSFGQEEPRSDYGHVIGLNIDTLARDTTHYNHYDRVLEQIHRSELALSGYAHFAYKGEGVTKGMALFAPMGQIDFVELMQNTQINQEDYFDYLNLGFRISAAAGSDFPWGSTIGDCRTFAYTGNKFSTAEWFKALKQGKTFVSNGPALFLEANGKMVGEELKVDSGATVAISVKAISHQTIGPLDRIEIYNSDGMLLQQYVNSTDSVKKQQRTNTADPEKTGQHTNTTRSMETLNHAATIDSIQVQQHIRVKESQWVTAAVFCKNGALAHTSPVYIIVDNKPVFNRKKAPALIARQNELLDLIIQEEQLKTHPDKGILERVERAKQYYQHLLKRFH